MKKKLFYNFIFVFVFFLFSLITATAEGYIFSTTEGFPIPRSSSIEIISDKNNVYSVNSLDEIQHLIDRGIIENYEENSQMELFDYTSSDPYFTSQENLTQVYAPFAWERAIFGNDVKVAVIDSGISSSIDDFNYDNIIRAEDYTPTKSTAFCEDDIKLDHGTKVASIIISSHNSIGIAGFAPNVKLYVFKSSYYDYTPLTDSDGNTITDANGVVQVVGTVSYTSNIIKGIYDAVEYGCDVINISAGTQTDSVELRKAVEFAEKNNVTIVAASGNSGNKTLYYPASYDTVIGVGFSTKEGFRHNLSQSHEHVNLMAPGASVYVVAKAASPSNFLCTTTSGSSFASPTVAAAVALAKQLNYNLTPSQIRQALYQTASPMYDNPKTTYIDESKGIGYGQLNIQALLTYVRATLEKGTIVYSNGENNIYSYLFAPNDCIIYRPTYDGDILTKVESYPSISGEIDSSKLFIWEKNSLSPRIITEKEY